jgi:hypothetical protein
MKTASQVCVKGSIRLATLPYYRLYHFNTVDPLEKIAILASRPSPDFRKLSRTVASWRARKLSELQFIIIAVRTSKTLSLEQV